MGIHLTTLTIKVLTDGPFAEHMAAASEDASDLAAIDYLISEGHGIAFVNVTGEVVVHPRHVTEELVKLGNDGTFFDD